MDHGPKYTSRRDPRAPAEAPSHGRPALLYDLKCAGSQAYLKLASGEAYIAGDDRLVDFVAHMRAHVRNDLPGEAVAGIVHGSNVLGRGEAEEVGQRLAGDFSRRMRENGRNSVRRPRDAGIELIIAAWHPFKTRRRVADLVRETI